MSDLIEREAVIAAIADEPFINDSTKAAFRNVVNKVLTITPESLVRHGRWKYYHKQNKAVCTNCGFERDLDMNFGAAISCPHCGAVIDLEE